MTATAHASATIASLALYPVKGLRGLVVDAFTLEAGGPAIPGAGDREWLVVDADGRFLSQRQLPRMALVECRVTPRALVLDAPGMPRLQVPDRRSDTGGDAALEVTVWNHVQAATDEGPEAAAWLSQFLRCDGARLVRFDRRQVRLASARYTAPHVAPVLFADAFPLLVVGEASVQDVNARLAGAGEAPIGVERFRANIVLAGIDPYAEDDIDELWCDGLRGGLRLRAVKPCSRCTVPGVDPATGTATDTVPDLLATFRRRDGGVMFGVNAMVVVGHGETLKRGAEARIQWRF